MALKLGTTTLDIPFDKAYIGDILVYQKNSLTDEIFVVPYAPSIRSSNGKTWVGGESIGSLTKPCDVIAYGNGKFVTIHSEVGSYYSLDGETWTAGTGLPTSIVYDSLTYGNDRFVTIDRNGQSYYSLDGITWTAGGMVGGTYCYGITYGKGMFVCVSFLQSAVYYSTDGGLNWTSAATLSFRPRAVTFGGDRFMAVGHDGGSSYSISGTSWTDLSGLIDDGYVAVTYGDGKFVAVGYRGAASYFIPSNGVWMDMTSIENEELDPYDFYDVAYGNGRFVAVTYSEILYSTSGTAWAYATFEPAQNGYIYGAIAFGKVL